MGMGINIFNCGNNGAGAFSKICNNLVLGVNMIAAAEGLSLGEKLGINTKTLS